MKKIMYLMLIFIIFFLIFTTMSSKIYEKSDMNNSSIDIVAGTDSIKIAFFNVEPHIFLDEKTGQMKGALYEFIENNIATEMGVKFIWDKQPSTIPRQLEILKIEKDYAAALLTATPDRISTYAFTKKPFFLSKSAIAVRKDKNLQKISTTDDLVGMIIGYADKAYISPFMKDSRIKFDLIAAPNFNEINFKKLLANRIDAVYAPDKASLLMISKLMNLSGSIKVLDLPEKTSAFHVVFPKSSVNIVDKYDKAFDKLNGQKLYLKLLNKYLDTSKL